MSDVPGKGGVERLGIRGSARMIAALSKQPAWVESMTPEMREMVVKKLHAGLHVADSAREVASIAKALAGLERNDIERTRLLIDHEQQEDGEQDAARRLRADLDEIDRIEGRRAD
jgi:hypothetical protein